MSEIDPFQYGQLVAKVDALEKKVDKLEQGMEQLLELANKSKGGFWMGMTVASIVGGVVTFIGSHWTLK
jgi:predicted PurR-regulated permease PerM